MAPLISPHPISTPPPPPPRERTGPAPTTQEGEPVDTASPGGLLQLFAGAAAAAVRGFFQERQEKDRLVDGMIARDTKLGGPTDEERLQLQGSLSRVDTEVLKFAHDRGTKLQVLRPGQEIARAGVLREQDPKKLEAELPKARVFADGLRADLQKRYGNRIDELIRQREAYFAKKGTPAPPVGFESLGGLFGAGAQVDPELKKLNDQIRKLTRERDEAQARAILDSGVKVRPFGPPPTRRTGVDPLTTMTLMHDSNVLAAMPASSEQMARLHGARTPEEKAEFYRLLEGINGADRLKEARTAGLAQAEKTLASMAPGEHRDRFAKQVAEMRKHPEKVPLDHQRYGILVPDTFYYRPEGAPEGAKATRYDYHDLSALLNWAGPDGKTDRLWSPENREGTGQLGQYFPYGNVNRILLHRDALKGDTPIHELGHAVDFLVEKEDPTFYSDWSQRLKKSFSRFRIDAGQPIPPGGPPRTVSSYALTNEREYLAEGFAHYYEDPKLLKARDPQLYQLTEELIQRARELSRK